jgi:microcystin-dependent protein
MAIMWSQSLTPWTDPNGAPYSGARAYFFDANTTTPRTVYRDSALSSPLSPIVANASGMFPAVFLSAGDYRLRIEDADGATIWDVDGISVPSLAESGGGGGDTPVELLYRTGDYKFRHDTGTHSGWVRANNRTIGSAASGAAERANADCEDLFLLLWADTTLTVVGGRGANAAADWAANKEITLPDMRLRGFIGMAGMGNATSNLINAASFDNSEDGNDLGATIGASVVSLTLDQIPSHIHTGEADSAGAHTHSYNDDTLSGSGSVSGGGTFLDPVTTAKTTGSSGVHTHDLTIDAAGGGLSHNNMQPSAVATIYIKL